MSANVLLILLNELGKMDKNVRLSYRLYTTRLINSKIIDEVKC